VKYCLSITVSSYSTTSHTRSRGREHFVAG
jgi:hypothetical protein